MDIRTIVTAALVAGSDLKIKDVMRETAGNKVTYNKGFAANRMDSRPKTVALVSAVMTALLTFGFLLRPGNGPRSRSEGIANGLILGGAISNTYERLVRGRVTDYIPLGKYVYNLADLAIYLGSVIKLISLLFRPDLER